MIDSHQHFWDRSLSQFDNSWQENAGLEKICRSFLPDDLLPLCQAAGVERTVVVQTQHNIDENLWALALCEQNELVAGVVGWVDLASDECESQLLPFVDDPNFVGIRHVAQDEPDPDFIIREDVSRGLAVLEKYAIPFDLLFYTQHLKHAATVARRFPNLPLVIDHLSKPNIKSGQLQPWQDDLAAVAACENVHCKLSGMVTEADWINWSVNDLRPFASKAIELFSPDRVMFGSDWPVCNLAATYQQVVETARELVADLTENEQAKIFGGTATKFYKLPIH